MDFKIAAYSDIGIKKKTNQDALLIQVAQTTLGKVCLCLVCDGVGGLSDGEIASTAVIQAFKQWFEKDFIYMLELGFSEEVLRIAWENIVTGQNEQLKIYAAKHNCRMGTTVVALLILQNMYYIMNVGDSRAYLLDEQLILLTKDQTIVQYEMDRGHMTLEEAQNHPQRSVLLQCVGASDIVTPDFYWGQICADVVFMLCSDGFRHMVSNHELFEQLNPAVLIDEQTMSIHARWLSELNKQRHEVDNISVALVRVCLEG